MSEGKKINLHQMFNNETGGFVDKEHVVTDSHGVHCETITLWSDSYVKWLQNKLVEQLLKSVK